MIELGLALIGTLVFLIGFPLWAVLSTGNPWVGLLMLLGCLAFLAKAVSG